MKGLYSNKTFVLSLIIVLSLITGCGSNGTNADNSPQEENAAESLPSQASATKGTVTIWHFGQISEPMVNAFHEVYPDIEIDAVQIPTKEMFKKFQVTLASGGNVPDVIMVEAGFKGQIASLDVLENLEKEPFQFDRNQLLDYSLPANVDSEGNLVMMPLDISLAGLAYKKDLAKQYLGTDDPEELESMLPDWQAFIEKGKQVNQASGGKVFMFPGIQDAWNILINQDARPLVDDGKLNKEMIRTNLETLIEMRDAGITDKIGYMTPAWNAAIPENNHIFLPSPIWFPVVTLKQNDPQGADRWGLMEAPNGGYIMGGTSMGIPKKAKNKPLAWAFIKWLGASHEGSSSLQAYSVYTYYKPFVEDLSNVTMNIPFFGDQDVAKKYFVDISGTARQKSLTKYDSTIDNGINTGLAALTSDPNATLDKILDKVFESIAKDAPELER